MSVAIRILPKARVDMNEIYAYLGTSASHSVAERFLREAELLFSQIANQPGIGEAYPSDNPHLAAIRIASISRFKSYLCYYAMIDGRIEIIRVLHGSRDADAILLKDLGESADDES